MQPTVFFNSFRGVHFFYINVGISFWVFSSISSHFVPIRESTTFKVLQLRWTGCKQVIVVCYKCRLTFYTDEFTVYCAAVVETNHTKQSRKCFRNMKRIVSDKSEILCDNANCLL